MVYWFAIGFSLLLLEHHPIDPAEAERHGSPHVAANGRCAEHVIRAMLWLRAGHSKLKSPGRSELSGNKSARGYVDLWKPSNIHGADLLHCLSFWPG